MILDKWVFEKVAAEFIMRGKIIIMANFVKTFLRYSYVQSLSPFESQNVDCLYSCQIFKNNPMYVIRMTKKRVDHFVQTQLECFLIAI